MKFFTVTILFISLTLQIFSSALVTIDYRVNKAYYLQNCENKNRPKLHCNGKCQMAKKIREQEEKNQKRGYELKDAISFYVPAKTIRISFNLHRSIARSFNLYHCRLDELKFSPSVFHPPCLLS